MARNIKSALSDAGFFPSPQMSTGPSGQLPMTSYPIDMSEKDVDEIEGRLDAQRRSLLVALSERWTDVVELHNLVANPGWETYRAAVYPCGIAVPEWVADTLEYLRGIGLIEFRPAYNPKAAVPEVRLTAAGARAVELQRVVTDDSEMF